jgi:tetratricopeptide (TPR) repeat protein
MLNPAGPIAIIPSLPAGWNRCARDRAGAAGSPEVNQSNSVDRPSEVETAMPTKKKPAAEAPAAHHTSEAYEAALGEYASGVEAMRKGEFETALEFFGKVRGLAPHEPELADRATIYARVCERKLAPQPGDPDAADDRFRRAVFLMNGGDVDEALQLLNRAVAEDPMCIDVLYVRACAWALKGAAEKAVGDLRQAIAVDPKIRFQAINDPDFERIREEPAFIDVIEPTPTGA